MVHQSTLIAFRDRLKEGARYYTYGLYQEIANKNLFLWAQAIAFKVLVTIVPVVVLATGLVGKLVPQLVQLIPAQVQSEVPSGDPFDQLAEVVSDFLPPSQTDQLIDFLETLYNASGAITLFGALGLFLSAWSLFITLRIAVSNAFEQDWHVGRSIIGGYLFDVRMVLQVGLLFVLTIGLSALAQSLGLGASWFRAVGLFAPFLITMAMFFQLFYFVPKPHPRKRSAFIGALLTAVLWEGAKQGFTYYATYVGHFDRYHSGSEMAALGNVFGIIIAFVFWVYFSAIVLMVGAVIASLHEHRYRVEQSTPAASAEPASPAPPDAPPAAAMPTPPDAPSRDRAPEEMPPEGVSARPQDS